MKQVKPKKEMTTVDALMEDYTSNKDLFNDIIHSQTLSHQYLEGIYLKYSKNLEEYMTKNKRGLRLSGNKKFMNVPIDLFLAESRKYKEEIINELKGTKKSKSTNNYLDTLFLTPLPDKPRVLLNTKKEKSDFQSAERQAVVMRTYEYTKALRYKGMYQYFQMKQEEKQQMIYIMKKATNVIEDWWLKKNKYLKFKRQVQNWRYGKYSKGLETIKEVIDDNIKDYFGAFVDILKNIRESQLKLSNYTITSFRLNIEHSSSSFYRFHRIIIKNKICYITKKLIYEKNNQSSKRINKKLKSSKCKLKNNNYSQSNDINRVRYIQQQFRNYLRKKKQNNEKKIEKATKMKKVILKSRSLQKRSLFFYFTRWLLQIHRYLSNKNTLSIVMKSKQSDNKKYLPTYLSYLPTILFSKFSSRYKDLFNALRKIQNKSKSIGSIINSLNRANKKTVLTKIKNKIVLNSLYKAVIHSDIQGKKWKYFQLWNIKNTILHIFVNKLIRFAFSFSKSTFFKSIKNKTKIKAKVSFPNTDIIKKISNTKLPSTKKTK